MVRAQIEQRFDPNSILDELEHKRSRRDEITLSDRVFALVVNRLCDPGSEHALATARRAVTAMDAIQPPTVQGVFFYSLGFEGGDLSPDVVILNVRPVELIPSKTRSPRKACSIVSAASPKRKITSPMISRTGNQS